MRLKAWPLPWPLRVGLSVALLAYLFSRIPARDVAGALGRAAPLQLAAALLLAVPAFAMGTLQQKLLADHQGMKLTFGELTAINLASRFYGLFLPGYLAGGAYRWARMAQPGRQPAEAFAVIAFNRWLETLVLLILGLLFWLGGRPAEVGRSATIAVVLAIAAMAAGYVLLFDLRLSGRLWERLGIGSSEGQAGTGRRILGSMLAATGRFGGLGARDTLLAGSLCVLRHLIDVLVFVGLASALGLDLPFAAAGWIHLAVLLAMMLPIAYAGLGVRETSLVVLLDLFGVGAADALALSFLLLARVLLTAGIGAGLEGARLLRTKPA
jgi:uncharacterized protein (TIRG00374 family)